MGTRYSTVLVGGNVPNYTTSNVADDGSQVEANRVKFSSVHSDLTSPLETAIVAMDTKLLAHTNEGPDTESSTTTLTTADHNTVLEATGTITLSLPNPSGNAGFQCTIKNAGSGVITVDVDGGANIDGVSSISLVAGEAVKPYVNNAETAYFTVVGTQNIKDGFPSGTIQIFGNNVAPTGWTKKTSAAYNNTAMRISTGTVSDVTTGSVDFDTVFGITATDDHTLTAAESGTTAHGHPAPNSSVLSGWQTGSGTPRAFVAISSTGVGESAIYSGAEPVYGNRYVTTAAISDSTAASASSGHSHNIDLQVRYRDVIAAEKD